MELFELFNGIKDKFQYNLRLDITEDKDSCGSVHWESPLLMLMTTWELRSPFAYCIMLHEFGHIVNRDIGLEQKFKDSEWEMELHAWKTAQMLCQFFLNRNFTLQEKKFMAYILEHRIYPEFDIKTGYDYYKFVTEGLRQ